VTGNSVELVNVDQGYMVRTPSKRPSDRDCGSKS
jgi:hypothetical protein